MGVVGWVVGPQYFHVIPWHFENGASSILMMFLLKMVDYSMSFLLLSTCRVDHSGPFLFSELFCGTPPSCLKVRGGWVVVVAYRILLSAPVPFGLIWVSNWVGLGWDWGLMGLGLGTRA